MSVPVTITLNSPVGSPGPFSLYSCIESTCSGSLTPFVTGVTLIDLQTGSFIPNISGSNPTYVKIKSTGAGCDYEIIKPITGIPTPTPTPTATSTPTVTPTPTATSVFTPTPTPTVTPTPTPTSTPISIWYQLTNCSDSSIVYSEEYPEGQFAINEKVTTPGNVWVITNVNTTTNPGGTLYAITSTGFMGCGGVPS